MISIRRLVYLIPIVVSETVNCMFSTNRPDIWCLIHHRVVPISYKQHVGSICTLRNYDVDQDQAVDLTIAEALMATLSTPPSFTPLSISKDASTFEYTGADWTLSNPTHEIISEAHTVFGAEERVACLLSLGCGRPGVFSVPEDRDSVEWNQFLGRLADDGERKAQRLESQMGPSGLFHRFSVTSGLENPASLGPGDIMTHTIAYLTEVAVSQKMDICVSSLKVRDGVSSLGQLSMSFIQFRDPHILNVVEEHPGGQNIVSPQLPPLTKSFVMRKEPWEFISGIMLDPRSHEDADESKMLVVTGMGGCGKTQLMIKFMKDHKAE